MKKLLVVLLAAGLLISVTAGDLSARGIIIKGGYGWMYNDLSDEGSGYEGGYEDQWTFGVFFDVGSFIFQSLKFRPGIDYIQYETEDVEVADVYGIHMDWYWYPMQGGAIQPFLGFGPSLNYYDYDDNDQSDDGDSDAGIDLFLGVGMGISGTPLELFIEARYRFMDIASRDENIVSALLGLMIKF